MNPQQFSRWRNGGVGLGCLLHNLQVGSVRKFEQEWLTRASITASKAVVGAAGLACRRLQKRLLLNLLPSMNTSLVNLLLDCIFKIAVYF